MSKRTVGDPPGLTRMQLRYARYDAEGVRLKVCTRCKADKSYWDDYFPRVTRDRLGPRQAMCKQCRVDLNREKRQADPRAYNAYQNEYRHRRNAEDPEYHEKRKQYWRDRYHRLKNDPAERERRALAQRVYRMKKGVKVGPKAPPKQTRTLLPVGPFKEWLDGMEAAGVDRETLARDGGKDARTIRRIMEPGSEQKSVDLDYADAVLTGQDFHLWELWPDLYE